MCSSGNVSSEQPVGESQAGAERRRWPTDSAFYTFNEFVRFFGDKAFAEDIWNRSIREEDWDKECTKFTLERLRADIQDLPVAEPGSRLNGSFVFQQYWPAPAQFGNSLRMNENGYADLFGGAGKLATFEVEPEASLHSTYDTQSVRLKNAIGGYLRLGPEQHLLFGGCPEKQDTLFEITWYISKDPSITLAHGTGQQRQLIGIFLPRLAKSVQPHCLEPWLERALFKAREEIAMDKSGQLLGKRRHRDNPSGTYHTFDEWVTYIYHRWLGACPMAYASVVLAKDLWFNECEPEGLAPDTDYVFEPEQGLVVHDDDMDWEQLETL